MVKQFKSFNNSGELNVRTQLKAEVNLNMKFVKFWNNPSQIAGESKIGSELSITCFIMIGVRGCCGDIFSHLT